MLSCRTCSGIGIDEESWPRNGVRGDRCKGVHEKSTGYGRGDNVSVKGTAATFHLHIS